MDRAKYDDVMRVLDWKNVGAPKGLVSHMAGPTHEGWGVVDVWESGLERAFQRVGARMPQMQITIFEVHNQYS